MIKPSTKPCAAHKYMIRKITNKVIKRIKKNHYSSLIVDTNLSQTSSINF